MKNNRFHDTDYLLDRKRKTDKKETRRTDKNDK